MTIPTIALFGGKLPPIAPTQARLLAVKLPSGEHRAKGYSAESVGPSSHRSAPPPAVRPMRDGDLVEAVNALSTAFIDDPAYAYLFPDRGTRADNLSWLLERWLRALQMHGEATVVGDKGFAFWIPPDRTLEIPLSTKFRAGLLAAPFRFGLSATLRAAAFDRDIAQIHREFITEPTYVLELIGTAPSSKGQGLGTQLVVSMLERADQEQMPCFVLTHNEHNVSYYERFGFELLAASDMPSGGPTVYSMRRPASTLLS